MSEAAIVTPADRSQFSLHPEDWVTQQDSHDEQLTYFKYALRKALPGWFVGRDLAVYWVPGQRQHPYVGPDILVARNRPPQDDPTVYLVYEDGPLTMVAEVASEESRSRERGKRDTTYAQSLRVPEYLFVDIQRGILQLWVLQGDQYVEVTPETDGRLWSQELDVGFAWQPDQRLVRVLTLAGEIVPTQQEEAGLRLAAEERADAERQRADELAAEVERLRKQLRGKGRS